METKIVDLNNTKATSVVTTEVRKLDTKESLSEPNPYTLDWNDMAEITKRHLLSPSTLTR